MLTSPTRQARPHDPDQAQIVFYARVAKDEAARTLALDHYIPRETGFAFPVKQGQVLRVTCCDGPQVADFNAFCATDASEIFGRAGRARYRVHICMSAIGCGARSPKCGQCSR